MSEKLKFGTGGWRAIIADGFTKENVQLLAQAVAIELDKKEIVIGYDRRFLSDIAAKWLAEVLAANGIKVYYIKKAVPTPMVMFAVNEMELDYGLAVTASHNPAIYNGVKVFTSGGRDAGEDVTEKLQTNVESITEIKHIDFEEGLKDGKIVIFDPQNDYIDSILTFIDEKKIRDANLNILIDTMYGVSKTSLSILLNTTRCDIDIINDRHDTLFGGKLPSPESSTLNKLSNMVVEGSYDMGIATDGDADRIGIIDEHGRFIHPNLLISLLYEYLINVKGIKGPVVRNLSTTHLLDNIAKKHGEEAIETPVGFKYISDGMEKHNAIIGGESSGGLTVKGHIKGKDGIFAAMILVEMVAVTGKSIGTLVDELYQEYGSYYNIEKSYRFSSDLKDSMIKTLMEDRKLPKLKKKIKKASYFDGLKVVFEDDSWVSVRFSGTEPLIRIFVESDNPQDNDELIKAFETFLDLIE